MAKALSKNDKELLAAAEAGDIARAEKALAGSWWSKPADINVEASYHCCLSPLLVAACAGKSDMVTFLLDKGANPHKKDKRDCSAIWYCVATGQKDNVVRLHKAGADLNMKHNSSTLLMLAISKDLSDVAGYLLDNNVDVNIRNNVGRTAVSFAVHQGNMNVLRALEKHGADFLIVDENGDSLLNIVSDCSDARIQVEMTQFLIDKGVEIDMVNNDGKTPLSKAVENSNEAVVQLLVQNGADINRFNKKGLTPFLIAARAKDTQMMRCLVEAGADVNAYDFDGMTALMRAAERDDIHQLTQLLELGADVYLKNSKEETALDVIERVKGNYSSRGKACIRILKEYMENTEEVVITTPIQTQSGRIEFNPKRRYSRNKLKSVVDQLDEDELVQYSTKFDSFVQQLVTTGLVIDALQKMAYDKTTKLYGLAKQKMSPAIRQKAEEIIRNKR